MECIVNLFDQSLIQRFCRTNGRPFIPLFWLVAVWYFTPALLPAQPKSYHFDHLTIDDGLSQNLVYSIEQDHRGFMWFGTNDGLDRYDGYAFKAYNHSPGDSTSLIDNSVTVVFKDSRQNLWVGAGGLNLYDRRNDRFIRILVAGDLSDDLSTLQLNDIVEDGQGNIWLSIRNAGIFRLELLQKEGALQDSYQLEGPYLMNTGERMAKPGEVHQLAWVGNALWATHDDDSFAVLRLTVQPDGRYPSPKQGAFEPVRFDLSTGKAWYRSLFLAPDNALWIGTSQGLICLHDPGLPTEYTFSPYPEAAFKVNWGGIPKSMTMDPAGKMWLVTYHGLMIFDPQTGKYRHLENDPDDPRSLSFDNFSDIFVDEGKVIWLGTVGMGLNKYISNSKPFRSYLGKQQHKMVNSVYAILEGPGEKIWAVVNSGHLKLIDPLSREITEIPPGPLKNWSITSLTSDRNDIFWITNDELLVRFNPRSRQMKTFGIMHHAPMSFPSDSVSALYIDRNDQIWLCNTGDLRRFNPSGESFENYPLPDLYLEKIEAFYRDEQGYFWIATLQGLLHFRADGSEWRFFQAAPGQPDSLQQNRVKCLLPDPAEPERYLWLGTGGGGLHRFDRERNAFQTYTQKDGLPNDFIYGLLPDSSGRLWMSTNHGLSCFDPEIERFTNFNVKDGLQSNEFNSRAYYKSDSGQLFFGGINGITTFLPEQIVPNPHLPPVVITEMKLSYQSILPDEPGSPLKCTITETKEVRLQHDQHDIAFEFAALDFTLPENNRYRYMLEGYDREWIDIGAERRATYTNLSSGHYTFRVQGANNDGIWNEEGAAIELIIAVPPWKTGWAFLLYALIAGVIGYAVYRYVEERRQMRDELRMRELEAQKLAELDRFKSQFFANISHEFRMPITLIQGRIEEVLQQINRPDLRKKLFSIQRSGRQLLRLIEQLLDIARLESSKMEIRKGPGDMVRFVRTLLSSLHSSAENKGVSLSFSSDEENLKGAFDPDSLQKILQNLISNAVKFSRPGGRVEVILKKGVSQISSGSEEETWIRIMVIDNGAGIPEKDLPHIFERFYQAENNSSFSEKGFGLGLALVKELIMLLNGTIEVESEVGRGTVFTLDIPIVDLSSSSRAGGAEPKLDPYLLEMELADLNAFEEVQYETGVVFQDWKETDSNLVLVVEDHAELRDYITDVLKPAYKVILAGDGAEGLEMARTHIPNLIISDVMMPLMDGYTLSGKLGADHRTSHIPLILLTAKAETADRIRGLQHGADDYLIKPFDEEELKTRVRNLIRKREELKARYSQSLLKGSASDVTDSLQGSFLKEVAVTIETHLADENFGVEVLAKALSMSSSQLYRKLRALTGLSTVQLIQQFKLERSAELLKQGHNVSEVAYMVGLRSPAYFSQMFKKHFGCTPKEFERV